MIDVIDEKECFGLLSSTTVGRVGFVRDGRIEIIPVNYRLRGRELSFHARADGILAGLPDEPDVAFEVDHHDDLGRSGWSVLLSGRVERLGDEDASADDVHPWAGGERELRFRFLADRVSGRRVRREHR